MASENREFSHAANRPEVDLLLWCCRTRMHSHAEAKIRTLLSGEIDWHYLVEESILHGLTPLVYWHLKSIGKDKVPAEIMGDLRAKFFGNAARNLMLSEELCKILSLFGNHGILAVPYKGPVLARSVYGDTALRQSSDLDILVPMEQVLRAKDLLLSRGFQPEFQLSPAQDAAYLKSQCEFNLQRPEDRVCVEIHWRIVPEFMSVDLDASQLLDRAGRTSIDGLSVPTLSPEDLLLVLCIHGYKHLWERLAWICDISEVLKAHPEMDWGSVMLQASRLGSERILFLGLFLASEILGASLPVMIRRRVQADPALHRLANKVWEVLFFTPFKTLKESEIISFYLRSRERVQDKVRCSLRLAVTPNPRDWELVALPKGLSLLHYPLRAIRLIGKFGVNRMKGLVSGNRRSRSSK